MLFFFEEKMFYACRDNHCFRYLHEDTFKNFTIFFCYEYFEDLFAPITFTKNFGFLASVVSKIFAINTLQGVSKVTPDFDFLTV